MSSPIEQLVQERYGSVARSGLSSEQGGVRAVAEAFGYTAEELASIPAEANMGLSCGNPVATASLREGEVVVDLGSGGGLDVFLAAEKVGAAGRAIGIDMTPEMLELARRNAAKRLEGGAHDNVEFHLATIDRLPLADASVDCVISNCVINLAPDKQAVFREVARVLKPGGRLAVSDIALKQTLPPEVSGDMLAYVGCIAGAIPIEDYKRGLVEAGFGEVAVIDSGADLNAYSKVENQQGCCSPAMTGEATTKSLPVAASSCCAPVAESASTMVEDAGWCCAPSIPADAQVEPHGSLRDLLARYDVNDYAASVKVFAVKPR
ncbi:MAG: arsenite methyltransferase [Acidobacteriota bacterium]|nr:arsenite methyltransferase [Acidobacteriota bacterium]